MKFFIHTADPGEITTGRTWGVIDGVMLDRAATTGEDAFESRLADICRAIDGPVIVEAASTAVEEILKEARRISGRLAYAVIAVPISTEGLTAARELSEQGIRVCAGPVRTLAQALMAAKSGAAYVTAPWGAVARDAVAALDAYGLPCEVIATGISGPAEVDDAIRAGAHGASITLPAIRKLFDGDAE